MNPATLKEFRQMRTSYVLFAIEHLSMVNPARQQEVCVAAFQSEAYFSFPNATPEFRGLVARASYSLNASDPIFDSLREQVLAHDSMNLLTELQMVVLHADFLQCPQLQTT